MFLFRRRKDSSEKGVRSKNSEKQTNPLERAGISHLDQESSTKTEAGPQIPEGDAPLKVVIPASALKEEEPVKSVPETEVGPSKPFVSDEIADGLLVKITRDKPVVPDIPDLNLAALKLDKAAEIAVVKDEKIQIPVAAPATSKDEKSKSPVKEPSKKTKEGEAKENIFSNMFGQAVEVEETSLDKLIKSLPEITIDEVLNEAEEVKVLMNEWYQSQEK